MITLQQKKIGLSIIAVLFLLTQIGLFSASYAVSDPGFTIKYKYTSSTSTSLSISEGEKATGTAIISGKANCTKVKIKMELQRKNRSSWVTMETWSSTANGKTLTLSRSKNVGTGKYRIHAVYTAYSGSKSETITQNSPVRSK